MALCSVWSVRRLEQRSCGFGCLRAVFIGMAVLYRFASCFGRVPCLVPFVMPALVMFCLCALCVAGGYGACAMICTGRAAVLRSFW